MVCPYSLSEPGGVQDQVIGLTRVLGQQGHDVRVIAPGPLPAGVPGRSVGRAFGFRVNGSVAPMAPQPIAGARTLAALRKGSFDVVHLHEPLAPSITIPALLARPAPLVATFHAAGERTPYRWWRSSLGLLAARIDVRAAVSEPAERLARRHLRGTYEILFNGVDLERFRGDPAPTPTAPTILFLGRHEPRKGLDVLLEALPLLPSEVTIRIAGDGDTSSQMRNRQRANAQIKWLGRLTEAEKLWHLRNASLLCAPSRHGESFGMVLLEAMAAGTPVVASDLPGYRSLSDRGTAAVLVRPEDPSALAEGLRQVLFDRRRAAQLRTRGREVARRFSLDALALRYLELYEQAARVWSSSAAVSHRSIVHRGDYESCQ